MKPKTLKEILNQFAEHFAYRDSYGWWGMDTNLGDLDGEFDEVLAQIQQLLEECAPEEKKFTYSDIYGDDPRNNYGYGEERYRDGATYGYAKSIDQYKSNLMGKLR